MFPVKGLSISAEKLKIETENGAVPVNAAPAPASKPARKRKRPNQQNVTAENFADLWDQVIEHKEAPKPGVKPQNKQEAKRQKTEHQPAPKDNTNVEDKSEDNSAKKGKKQKQKKGKQETVVEAEDDFNGFDDEEDKETKPTPVAQDGAGKKRNKKDKKQQPKTTDDNEKNTTIEPAPPKPAAAPPVPAGPKLTPLQASMREKLISARFRHLNETLYTRPSKESFSLFAESPEMFTEYHEGFRRQVEVWPENPVDVYINEIKTRGPLRQPPKSTPTPSTTIPLPRDFHTKTCTIADLGCGDAKLSSTLQPFKRKLKLDIHSFDLQTGGNPLVTKADIANLPLEPSSADVVIFCLALMGTNWTDFIEEAYRILRWKGELWVAEIKSRFANPTTTSGTTTTQPAKVVTHSVGNRRKNAKPTPKQTAAEEAADLADLAEHVDGEIPMQKSTTDITAFVSALQSRGFLLNRDMGEHAVDMSNKMFVRMSFVKAAPALVGKCSDPKALEREARLKEQREVEKKLGPNASKLGKDRGFGGTMNGFKDKKKEKETRAQVVENRKKFVGAGREEVEEKERRRREQGILKPCVYKLR
ncbi:putative ribosomal RNA-processing protein 8 [Triangularia verruculosa]|uniref:Ribosomal RNA-processing protein 8 n=1 Tax=Triangularia verruculosa TaxID=2587418 RepID=A0AAN6XNP2_9PEZI|nr:putative ribosomal RNA-processing protein 8 [Triangularia verruculosa]